MSLQYPLPCSGPEYTEWHKTLEQQFHPPRAIGGVPYDPSYKKYILDDNRPGRKYTRYCFVGPPRELLRSLPQAHLSRVVTVIWLFHRWRSVFWIFEQPYLGWAQSVAGNVEVLCLPEGRCRLTMDLFLVVVNPTQLWHAQCLPVPRPTLQTPKIRVTESRTVMMVLFLWGWILLPTAASTERSDVDQWPMMGDDLMEAKMKRPKKSR